jgi:para-nitrobenzyl esterase
MIAGLQWVQKNIAAFGGGPDKITIYAYVFQHLYASNPQIAKTDLEISNTMATCWTNFAKHDYPSGEGVPVWPVFRDTNPVVVYFNKTPHTGPVPSAESLKSLDEYFAWRLIPEGEAWANYNRLYVLVT